MGEHRDTDLQGLFALDAWPGPARPIDDARFSAIVAGALGGAGFPPPPVGPGGAGGAHGAAKVAGSTAAKGLAAGKLTVLIGGALGAAIATVAWIALRTPSVSPSASVPRAPVSAVATAPASDVRVPTAVESPAAPIPAGETAPAIEVRSPRATRDAAPAVAPAPAIEPGERRRAITAGPAHPGGVAKGGRRRVAKPNVAPADDPAPIAAPRTPDDLLAEANAARAAHRWRDADALYARVAGGEPAGLAAQTAQVASASIRLEHLGDPAGAARRFRAALAAGPRDALAEDARWGLAEVARVTGDTAAERRALDDFLAHHAGSPRAPRARARRTELGAPP